MDRENYQKVVDRLGYEMMYHFARGTFEDFTCDARIDIDNSEGKATEVLERIVAYTDALLYDMDRYGPTNATDVLDFVVEDERYRLDLDEMIHDADEAEWEKWGIFREKMLNAKKMNVEYWFSYDTIFAEDLAETALTRMLEDLLADGRLADCVNMRLKVLTGDIALNREMVGRMPECRYLWMNGMHNGQYVCGEVPFESNEAAIRSCSGWQEADEGDTEQGLILKLHPKTSAALLKRVREEAKSFAQKIDCEMKLMMSYNDFRNEYFEYHAEIEDTVISCVDKAVDDAQQRDFPDLRVYFTPEEKQALLDYYPTLSKKFVQYADSSYTADDLERIRFLWTLALLGELEGFQPARRRHWDSERLMNWTFMNAFRKLPEEIRLDLYGVRSFDLPEESKDYFSALEEVASGNILFFNKHSGIGDLSLMDDELYASIRSQGYFLQVNNIHLKDIDDVHLMCDFMNELKEIERLAQMETGEPIPSTQTDERFNQSLSMQWWDFASSYELEKEIPAMTIREYHEKASERGLVDMNQICMSGNGEDAFYFEPDESSQWARLRFRLENGKYIYEIAQIEA